MERLWFGHPVNLLMVLPGHLVLVAQVMDLLFLRLEVLRAHGAFVGVAHCPLDRRVFLHHDVASLLVKDPIKSSGSSLPVVRRSPTCRVLFSNQMLQYRLWRIAVQELGSTKNMLRLDQFFTTTSWTRNVSNLKYILAFCCSNSK